MSTSIGTSDAEPEPLPASERARIRAEERYRFAVRGELEAETPRPSLGTRLIGFLNSNLGVWLLSALFVSGAGAAMTRYITYRSEMVRRRDTIERLDNEIAYRLSQTLQHLYALSISEQRRPGDLEEITSQLRKPLAPPLAPLYPEYEAFSAPALVAELRRLVPDAERFELDFVIGNLTSEMPSRLTQPSVGDPKASAKGLLQFAVLPRWKKKYFYLLNCTVENPFCQ